MEWNGNIYIIRGKFSWLDISSDKMAEIKQHSASRNYPTKLGHMNQAELGIWDARVVQKVASRPILFIRKKLLLGQAY